MNSRVNRHYYCIKCSFISETQIECFVLPISCAQWMNYIELLLQMWEQAFLTLCLPSLWGLTGGSSSLIMQTAISSETLGHLYQYTCLYVPEGSSVASDFRYMCGCTFIGNSSYTSLQLVNWLYCNTECLRTSHCNRRGNLQHILTAEV